MMNGFIKVFRQIQDWQWYTDSESVHFFIHCILMANWQDKKWQGETIKRGQFITSLNNLSIQTGMSVKQVRKRIKRLEDTNEIVTERTNKFTKITVCKYDTYQSIEIEEGKQGANKGQTKGKQRATTKEVKNIKKDKNNTIVNAIALDVPNASDSQTWHASCRIANRLLESICEYDPTHKYHSNPPSIGQWVKDIDLALRRDGRTEEQMNFIIDAIFKHSDKFPDLWDKWAMNIESGGKLRSKFDQIKNQIKSDKNVRTNQSIDSIVDSLYQ